MHKTISSEVQYLNYSHMMFSPAYALQTDLRPQQMSRNEAHKTGMRSTQTAPSPYVKRSNLTDSPSRDRDRSRSPSPVGRLASSSRNDNQDTGAHPLSTRPLVRMANFVCIANLVCDLDHHLTPKWNVFPSSIPYFY